MAAKLNLTSGIVWVANWINQRLLLGGDVGAATTTYKLVKKVTGIADNSATDVLTVTVPNANHAAVLVVWSVSSTGSTDAFESSRVYVKYFVIARTTGADTVTANVGTIQAIATVAGGATLTTNIAASALTGASSATQTFTLQATLDDSGNLGSNQIVLAVELINAEASGITIS